MKEAKEKVKSLFELLLNHPDGVCTPTEIGNEIESLASSFGFKAEFNEENNKYEVVEND